MPNIRSPNQKPIACWMDAELILALERGRKQARVDRSQFIRDAIVERLQRLGIDIDPEKAMPPDRGAAIVGSIAKNMSGGSIGSINVATKAPTKRSNKTK